MSLKSITWAFSCNIDKPTAKFVLVALSNYADDSDEAFPSIARLCADTNLDKKTVKSALKYLRDVQLISDSGRRVGSTKKVVVYKINHVMSPKTDPLNEPKNGPIKQAQKRTHLVETGPKTDPLNEPKNGPLNRINIYNNNSDTSYRSDPLKEFAEIAPLEAPPVDEKKLFWADALRKLRNMAVPEPKARAMIGKWLKQTGDDRDAVMAGIDRAVEVGTMEPVSYVTKTLDKKSFTPHKEQKRKEWDDAFEWLKTKSEERKARDRSDDPRGSDRDDHGGVSDVEHGEPTKVRKTRRRGSGALPAGDAGETGGSVHGDPVEGQVHAVDSGIDF